MPPQTNDVTIDVGDGEAGSRIDRFLGHRFYPAYSRSFLTGLIASGEIKVNGRRVRPAYRLGVGDKIEAHLAPQTESSPTPEPIELTILHEDDHILVVEKPAGMVVHPGPGTKTGTLVNALLHHDPEIAKVGVVFRPGIVHRLDANTTGVMVVAKTNHARQHLVEQFKAKKVQKEYRAVVVGTMPFDSDYIDLAIGKDKHKSDRMRIDPKDGKPSSTFYEVVERFQGATHVKAMPHTGRTHQIRVHLAQIGFPVAGDPVYGRQAVATWQAAQDRELAQGRPGISVRRHALHAHRLSLEHPVREERMTFESPIPADMTALLEFLREHSPDEDAR